MKHCKHKVRSQDDEHYEYACCFCGMRISEMVNWDSCFSGEDHGKKRPLFLEERILNGKEVDQVFDEECPERK